jgi:hypothetical protein
VRGGRSDLRGAFRLSLFFFALQMIRWAFEANHVASSNGEIDLLLKGGLQTALSFACFVGLMYLAFEPYLRKHAPERVISWNRLLAGDWRDPLVGRDVLIGLAATAFLNGLSLLNHSAGLWLGYPPSDPISVQSPLLGIRGFPVLFVNQISRVLVTAFIVSFLVLFFSLLLRRKWLRNLAAWLIITVPFSLGNIAEGIQLHWLAFGVLFSAWLVFMTARFGVLAVVSAGVLGTRFLPAYQRAFGVVCGRLCVVRRRSHRVGNLRFFTLRSLDSPCSKANCFKIEKFPNCRISVRPLCLCGKFPPLSTTETQRTQRTHREDLRLGHDPRIETERTAGECDNLIRPASAAMKELAYEEHVMKVVRRLVPIFLLLLCPALASATGPSSADFKIVPIAHNGKGVVLFKTYYTVNATGGHSLQEVEFGWLVVSANGLWEEALHRVFDPSKLPEDQQSATWDQYHKEFEQDFDWASPPRSVRPLLRKYRFANHRGFSQTTGAGAVTWESERVCVRGICTSGRMVHRSLHSFRSERGTGSRVQSSFYYAGVAVFKSSVDDDDKSHGAKYFIPIRDAEFRSKDPGVDYWRIDGIVIIKGKTKRKP